MTALWTQAELSAALGARRARRSARVSRASRSTAGRSRRATFSSPSGAMRMTVTIMSRAPSKRAPLRLSCRASARTKLAALGPVFAVDDTLEAMERLGVAARARSKAKIVGVTGSVGKTTAKEMLRAMLTACGATHASAASYNNHWGVPLTLARMPANARFGVFEMGMNHAGEIAPLTRMARPHVALVTTIAPVHIEHLGSIEAIADAKAEIFLGLEPHGTAVLNRDAPQFERLKTAAAARGARVLSFGRGADCDARLLDVEAIDGGSRVRARVLGRELAFELGAPGAHMAQNALGALLAAEALGADLDACAAALRSFLAAEGQGRALLCCRRRMVRRPSSTKATTPIPLRCARRWRCSPRRSPDRRGAASRSSATCWSLGRRRRRCTPNSPPTSAPTRWISCSARARSRARSTRRRRRRCGPLGPSGRAS